MAGAEAGADHLARLLTWAREHRVEPIAVRLVASIEAENQAYDDAGVVPADDLWTSCRDNVQRVLDMLVEAVRPDGSLTDVEDLDPLFDAARATGRRRAEQGLALSDLLRSYRIGGRLIWEDLAAQADPPLTPDSFRDLGVWLWASVDTSSAEVAAAYRRVEQQRVRADAQRMVRLWEGLFSGRARESAFAQEFARATSVSPDGPVAVVLARGLSADEAVSAVADAQVRHGFTAAWHERPDGYVVGLLDLSEAQDPRAAVGHLERSGGLAGGISDVVSDLRQAPEALQQAQLAAHGRGEADGLSSFQSQLVPALLLSAPDVAGRLVRTWLVPVVRSSAGDGEALLETLHAWVAEAGSVARTAARIPCHRNTVINRLTRIARIVDHDLTDGPPLGLVLALQARGLGLV